MLPVYACDVLGSYLISKLPCSFVLLCRLWCSGERHCLLQLQPGAVVSVGTSMGHGCSCPDPQSLSNMTEHKPAVTVADAAVSSLLQQDRATLAKPCNSPTSIPATWHCCLFRASHPSVRLSLFVLFSKTYCPYCIKAKKALGQFLQPNEMQVVEVRTRLQQRLWACAQAMH